MSAAPVAPHEAAPPAASFLRAAPRFVVGSLTEAVGCGAGRVVVSGSHGGLGAARCGPGQPLRAWLQAAGVSGS